MSQYAPDNQNEEIEGVVSDLLTYVDQNAQQGEVEQGGSGGSVEQGGHEEDRDGEDK